MNSQNIILGVFLILFGISLTIWEIRTFVKRQQGYFGWDVYGLVFGVGLIVCGIVLLNK